MTLFRRSLMNLNTDCYNQGLCTIITNEELSKEERQIYLERMLDGTHQLTHLTDNILKLSKLENQGIGLDFQYFRLDEQIREVILFLQPKWGAAKLVARFGSSLDGVLWQRGISLSSLAEFNGQQLNTVVRIATSVFI